MLRSFIAAVGMLVTLGGGNLLTILLVRELHAPILVAPAILIMIALSFAILWLTAPAGLTAAEKFRRLAE